MDLHITGRSAIVCASSRGLGLACATALAREGVRLVMNGRDRARLDEAARHIADETGVDVVTVAGSMDDAGLRAELVAEAGTVDILVNNNGGPPLRDFRSVDREALLSALEANMIAPIDMVRRVIDGMVERRFGRIVNITSSSVKMPLPMLDMSSGARAGLTGYLGGVARQVARDNVTINFLLPGSFETDRLTGSFTREGASRGIDPAELAQARRDEIPAARFGQPAEFGAACAFLCAATSGYVTGQSLLIDGGAYPGIL
ncbi:SDR family oxidoreductase [Aureimonas frigidaquae]|uniref:SDR family oxidoreductase n=1 Tax=Aureimonas frigidaquae TaxID=424757 RepID=UPI0007845628|nr:SDR family oxidoreductase [Aureimonas frigidaquae]